jgi:hypothetical protein
MKISDVWIDLVNLRSETYAEESRIPTMEFGTPEQDALRRDFTFNALFYNINEGVVEDLTGRGLEDLRAGVLRTPLPPAVTFLDGGWRAAGRGRPAGRPTGEVAAGGWPAGGPAGGPAGRLPAAAGGWDVPGRVPSCRPRAAGRRAAPRNQPRAQLLAGRTNLRPPDPRADPLRVLRAVRFATRFGFQLHEDIMEAASSEQVGGAGWLLLLLCWAQLTGLWLLGLNPAWLSS